MLKQIPHYLLFSTIIQIIGILFFGWDTYAIINVWLFALLLLAIQDTILSLRQKKDGDWWMGIVVFWIQFIPFFLFLGIFGTVAFSNSPVLDIPGGLRGWMFMEILTSMFTAYWALFGMVFVESLLQFRKRLQAPPGKKTMIDSRALTLSFLGLIALFISAAFSAESLDIVEKGMAIILLILLFLLPDKQKHRLSPVA